MTFKPGDVNLADPDQLLEVGMPPYEYFATLRREAPVHWNPPPDKPIGGAMPMNRGFWVLSKYQDVNMASRDAELFSSWLGGPVLYDPNPDAPPGSPHTLEGQRTGLMGKDHPEHTAYRKLVSAGFTPKNIAKLEPMIKSHAKRIIDRVRDADDGEFVFTVAAELPMMTLTELMGVPKSDWKQFFEWGNAIAAVEDPDTDALQVAMELFGYCHQLVEEKRKNPDGSMLSNYANKDIDGERLTDFEINMFFLTLSIAGHETTRNTTAHVIRLLSEFPEQRAVLLDDLPGRLPNAIEETLRFSPPVVQFRRTATRDFELHGVRIEEGDKVYLSYASANRDEEVFTDPDRFDILRPNADQHLSFGAGPHYCMGTTLARLQMRTILEELLTARPQVHVSGPVTRLRSIWFNALTEMPVEYGACPAPVAL
ncbi:MULTISPECIES: cytochrome P450 [unclassified Nocardia]|uniref:cytochrome P450 n=1 Tax=unclassified Nocardia TaxID=2637762 RepID=UPI00341D5343